MRRRANTTIGDLRAAIDCLPRDTRIAMLRGIQSNRIIAGAYSDGEGICPMLAAHRAGGRTSFVAFARAWDNFAFRGKRARCSRRATRRELLTLRTHLEASLLADETPHDDLTAAIAEHRALLERRAARADASRAGIGRGEARFEPGAGQARRSGAAGPRPGDPDRSSELRRRGGWRWMRPVRTLEDYERTLQLLRELEAGGTALDERPAAHTDRPPLARV